VRQQTRREVDTVRQTDLVEVTLQSTKAGKVQGRLAVLENYVAGTAVAHGPEDDVVRSRHAAHPSDSLCSLRGKDLFRDLDQVNVLHDYVGHPSIVMEEVVDLWYPRGIRIALGEVSQVVQRHGLGVEGRVAVKLDKVLAEWEAASVVAVIPILGFVLGACAHDGWLEGGKVRGRRHWWESPGCVEPSGGKGTQGIYDETDRDECLRRGEEKRGYLDQRGRQHFISHVEAAIPLLILTTNKQSLTVITVITTGFDFARDFTIRLRDPPPKLSLITVHKTQGVRGPSKSHSNHTTHAPLGRGVSQKSSGW